MQSIETSQIRKKFLAYLEQQNHAQIPSAALVPDNDPTTLFTGSGMQPLIPYLLGQSHPKGTRLANSQKCFRAEDIDEVGDNRHTTFFEMLGNWSLGDYFKAEQLRWFFTFLVDEIGLDPNRLYVTVFAGDDALGIPRDDESVAIWQTLFAERGITAHVAHIGSEAAGYELGMQDARIFYYDASKNWWSRAGTPEQMPVGEIGGPDSEVFYDFGPEFATHPAYKDLAPHPNSDSGQFLEIGNNVFIEYQKQADGSFTTLPQQNVDFGGGLERIAAAAAGDADVFKIDVLWSLVTTLANVAATTYDDNQTAYRIVADHVRGAVFMIGDGVLPGNTEQPYFVRRLLRRAVRFADQLEVPPNTLSAVAATVIKQYSDHYPNLVKEKDHILAAIAQEEAQFRTTLAAGLKELQKLLADQQTLSAENIFTLITTHGFPRELVAEVAEESGVAIAATTWHDVDVLLTDHREKSRAGAEHKFKGGLADNSDTVVQYHTATHLLLAGLRKYLGSHVHQAGSNITGERLRFDFTHTEKIDPATLSEIEAYVNAMLHDGGVVTVETMSKAAAEADESIEGSFWDRYPDEVTVYTIVAPDGSVYSRELCGGPHVGELSEIAGTFQIKKEESSSAGVRRIKAVLRSD